MADQNINITPIEEIGIDISTETYNIDVNEENIVIEKKVEENTILIQETPNIDLELKKEPDNVLNFDGVVVKVDANYPQAQEAARVATEKAEEAKDWATKTDGTVDGVDYSSKYYAQSILPISTEITTVAGIKDEIIGVYSARGAVQNVSNISTEVVNVSDNRNAVVAVNNNITDVNTVASNITDVSAVSSNISNVNAVASNETNINAVNANKTHIDTVATDILDVKTVSNNISDVQTVSGDITNVNSVASDIANINAVAGDLTNIDSVAGDLTNIDSVSGDLANIDAVNANKTNIDAVAGNNTNITAVANNATNINAVAGNASNINTVAGISSDVSTVAGNTTNINTVAGISSNVTTVANNISDVNTVVANITDIQNASANAQLAKDWANKTNGTVDGSEYSSKYYAEQAATLLSSKQDQLTSANAGTGISITGSGGNIKINNTQTSAEWGNITGTLSSQTDLQNALNAKYDASNPSGYITGINSSDVTSALGYTPVNPTSLSTVATSGSYNDLTNKPTIPSVDQTYSSSSTNAQSGVAVSQALATISVSTDNTTISKNGSNALQAIGLINKNIASGATNPKYDWVGTLQEYETQQIETNHPEWICYITDDVSGGTSVYTKDQVNTLLNNKQDTLTAGTNITISDNVISASSVNIGSIFPVGSCYVTIGNTNPNTILGFGTWTLVTSSIVSSVDTNVPCKGNGTVMGLSDGTVNYGLVKSHINGTRYVSGFTNLYGATVGTNGVDDGINSERGAGLSTDSTKSGIVGTVTRTSLALYIWQRTA